MPHVSTAFITVGSVKVDHPIVHSFILSGKTALTILYTPQLVIVSLPREYNFLCELDTDFLQSYFISGLTENSVNFSETDLAFSQLLDRRHFAPVTVAGIMLVRATLSREIFSGFSTVFIKLRSFPGLLSYITDRFEGAKTFRNCFDRFVLCQKKGCETVVGGQVTF